MKKIITLIILSILISCSLQKKTIMNKKHFKFNTQYHQFYLSTNDEFFSNEEMNTDEKAFNERLGIENNGLVIFTQCYGEVKGEIEVLDIPSKNIDYTQYDHIVEGGINVQSGELQILNCPNGHLELSLKVTPGKYRVRVYSSNLASVIDDDGDDYYRIELWKSDDLERKVLKQYGE